MDTQKVHQDHVDIFPSKKSWINLESIMQVQVISEVGAYALDPISGWRAGHPGKQTLRFIFKEPLKLRRIRLVFEETELERAQQFLLRWSSKSTDSYQDIITQQYNFSPSGSICEEEEYEVDLDGAVSLELQIDPDIHGSEAFASLKQIQLA
ncbi:MAG: carbohydrate-binding protein [SAR324 cluster bacterium]|nr:carbohydrate-binding protein [SAR324 cluster bacterium]